MGNKGNQAIAIDREAVSTYFMYARNLKEELEKIRSDIATPITYLTSEDNISGSDAESFFESLNILKDSLNVMQQKMDTVAKFTNQLADSYNLTAATKKRSLREAKEDMAKALMKAKQFGK